MPFNSITDERAGAEFTTYFHTSKHAFSKTTAAGTTALSLSGGADLALSGGATVVPNNCCAVHAVCTPSCDSAEKDEDQDEEEDETHKALSDPNHKHFSVSAVGDFDEATGDHYKKPAAAVSAAGDMNIRRCTFLSHSSRKSHCFYCVEHLLLLLILVLTLRSGEPKGVSLAMMSGPFFGKGVLSSVSTILKYVIGYEGANGAVMKLVYQHDLECPGGNSTVLWSSKPLTGPSFDKCKTCYANTTVAVSNLAIDTATPGALAIQVHIT